MKQIGILSVIVVGRPEKIILVVTAHSHHPSTTHIHPPATARSGSWISATICASMYVPMLPMHVPLLPMHVPMLLPD